MNIKERLKTISGLEIFVIITIVFLTIFTVKFFGKKKELITIRVEVIKKNWVDNYDPYGYRAPFWLSDKVKIGQVEKNKTGKTIATLINLENYERGGEEAELFLTLRLEVLLDKRTGIYYFKDKPLSLGSTIDLNLDNIDIPGQVVDINVPNNGYPTAYFYVKAMSRNLDSWKYLNITPGLKVLDRANDEVIAEITKTRTEDSSLQKMDFTSGYLSAVKGETKDVTVEMKVKGYNVDDRWYFEGHQNLKIGNLIYIYTDKINLYGFEIEDIKQLP